MQDVQIGGRQSNSTYQFTLQSDDLASLRRWATRLAEQMKQDPVLTDIDTDQQDHGIESFLTVDRATASASASARAISTTPCTTRSASARCPRSTPASTSIT